MYEQQFLRASLACPGRLPAEKEILSIYRPETERVSHYFRADMPRQFDGVYHFDETRAVEPLEKLERWHDIEPPETYPSGF